MYTRIRALGIALLLVWCAALFPSLAAAQKASAPGGRAQTSPSAPPSSDPSDQQEEYVFPMQIQVVTVPVTVTGPKGEFVTYLEKRDFTIYDNGQPQRIDNFELSSEPLSVAIVVETSSRVQTLLPDLRAAGILITQLILGESGEATVLTFDQEVKVAQEFTDDADKIEAAMSNLKPGAVPTHLSDAVGRAVFMLQRRPSDRRKVIIVIAEARDMGSKNRFGMVLRGAQQLGISVYTIGLSTFKTLATSRIGETASSPYPPGVVTHPLSGGATPTLDSQSNWGDLNLNVLDIISDLVTTAKNLVQGNPLTVFASGTGGADFPTEDKGKLEKALTRIGEELRNQYVLTYRPSDVGTEGYHTIQVTVSHRDMQARYRPGYVLAPSIRSGASTPPSSSQTDSPAAPSKP